MNDNPRANGSRGRDPYAALRLIALIAAIAGVVVLAAAAFVLSYGGIHKIALSAGVSPSVARIFPVIFDAMLVVSCAAVVSLRSAGWWQRTYSWLSTLALLVVVAAADAAHATGTHIPRKPAAATVADPPVGPPAAGVQPAPVDAPAVPPHPGSRGRRACDRQRRNGNRPGGPGLRRPRPSSNRSRRNRSRRNRPAGIRRGWRLLPARAGDPRPARPGPCSPAVAGTNAVHPARTAADPVPAREGAPALIPSEGSLPATTPPAETLPAETLPAATPPAETPSAGTGPPAPCRALLPQPARIPSRPRALRRRAVRRGVPTQTSRRHEAFSSRPRLLDRRRGRQSRRPGRATRPPARRLSRH